eukprot:SAG22_NODE_336_length_12071_cov_10.875125_1_plen_737_part_00
MITAAFLLCAGGGAAHEVDISSQLKGLDVPEGLQQFLGAMVTKMRETEAKNEALQSRAQVVEAELRDEISWLKKDREAFQNKTRAVEAELRKENAALWITVTDLQNQAKTNSARLDQCEADTHPFIQETNRRRIQEDTLCRGSGLTAMFQACCPSGSSAGNGHRILQLTEGCDALPGTCSASCAPLFIEYFEGCQGMLDDLAPHQRQMFVGFYGGCQEVEQAAAAMLQDARPAMIFHVVVMNEAAAQQAQMFGGGNAPAPPVGPIGPLPPSPSPAGGAEIAQEFQRVCTTANLTVCVPQCNSFTYGFLLSIEIDGRGTVMTCNKMGLLFSWQGQASLGGYIGDDFQAFFSSVVSGAAGTYMIRLNEDAEVHTTMIIQPGQHVHISSIPVLSASWGDGPIDISIRAQLSLVGIVTCYTTGQHRINVMTGGQFVARSTDVAHYVDIQADGRANLTDSTIMGGETAWSVRGILDARSSIIDGTLSIEGDGRMAIEDCFLSGNFKIDGLGPHAHFSIARMSIFDPYVLRFGFHEDNRGGDMTISTVNFQISNGAWVVIDGQMPGEVVATLGDEVVGTLTVQSPETHELRDVRRATSTPAGWWQDTVWHYRSSVRNFTLHMLPSTTVFSQPDRADAETYSSLCVAAGLQPVSTGEDIWGTPCSSFFDLGCMALTNADGGSTPLWINAHTGWVDIVTFGVGPPSGRWLSLLSLYHDQSGEAYAQSNRWGDAVAAHAVCGQEV